MSRASEAAGSMGMKGLGFLGAPILGGHQAASGSLMLIPHAQKGQGRVWVFWGAHIGVTPTFLWGLIGVSPT